MTISIDPLDFWLLVTALALAGVGLYLYGHSRGSVYVKTVLSELDEHAVASPTNARALLIERRRLAERLEASTAEAETAAVLAAADKAAAVAEELAFTGTRRSEFWKGYDRGLETGAVAIIEAVREEAFAITEDVR